MKFRHHLKDKVYTVVPAYQTMTGGRRETTRAIRAIFGNHKLDTEEAQRVYRWSDVDRELVEKYLLTHQDMNMNYHLARGGLYLAEGEQVPDQLRSLLPEPQVAVGTACTYTQIDGDHSERCGKPPVKAGLCLEHARLAGVEIAS